jgi:tetratricopeptide (TPR) repeat protein
MRFSICLIEPEGYKFSHFLYDLCKYFCFTIEANGHECCMVKNRFYSDRINVILGAHNLTDPAIVEQLKRAGKYVIVQSEVLREGGIVGWPDQKSFTTVYLPILRQACAVWDGIESNQIQLQKLGIAAERVPRFGYLPAMEEIVHKKNKDIDFLYYGSLTPHRKKLIDELKALGGNVVSIFDEAAIFRNDYIARTRIHLAPNQAPGISIISPRILYLLNNRSIVVVERCQNQDWIEPCYPSTDAGEWAKLCLETLQHPQLDQLADEYFERYKKLNMAPLFKPLLDKLNTDQKASSQKSSEEVDIEARLNLIDLYKGQKQYEPAIALAKETLKVAPHNVNVLTTCGLLLLDTGDLTGAERVWKELPSSASVTHLGVKALLIGLIQRRSAIISPDTLLTAVDAAQQAQDWPQVITLLKLLLGRVEPGQAVMAELWNRLGTAYYHSNNLPEALIAFEQGLQLNPKNVDLLNNLANLYHGQGQYDQATAFINRILTINPDEVNTLLLLGNCAIELAQFKTALMAFQRVQKLAPETEGVEQVITQLEAM